MVCKVCGAELRGNAKFCNKCGVPLSLVDRFGADAAGSDNEMTVVAVGDDDEVPTVDAPAIEKPVAASTPPTAPTQIPVQRPTLPTPTPVAAPPRLNPTFAPNLTAAQTRITVQPPTVEKRPRHILLSKPAATILFVFIFAAVPLFVPGVGGWLSSKDQSYREMLPDPHELITFKSSGGSSSDTTI
ncbi:MAG: zinc ribbon domain-containing protein, partial [Acidobacteriota bacterium]|nr:zinc ribbon domain-containing protein [Acidobacteriota bacterium]